MKPTTRPAPLTMIEVHLENVSGVVVPDEAAFRHWAEIAAPEYQAGVSIRIVDEAESAGLNETYRHKAGSTNVLSFPCEVPEGVPNDWLGDLVICATVVEREALEQAKSPAAHWAHMVVHGLLHLQGYDHIETSEAEAMESLEIAMLARLGFPNPYEEALLS